jgi:hypothetical protein
VVFRDFYVGDQLISLAITLMDFEFIACFYVSDVGADFASSRGECLAINIWIRPLIAALPAYWRFVQSLRRYRDGRDLWQVANAGKYATSLVVTMFSILRALHVEVPAFTTLWIVSLTVSALFGYYWDMYRDFGFFHVDRGDAEARFLSARPAVSDVVVLRDGGGESDHARGVDVHGVAVDAADSGTGLAVVRDSDCVCRDCATRHVEHASRGARADEQLRRLSRHCVCADSDREHDEKPDARSIR